MRLVCQHTSDIPKKQGADQIKQESRVGKEEGKYQNRMGIYKHVLGQSIYADQEKECTQIA
jgi:hypothetical protein